MSSSGFGRATGANSVPFGPMLSFPMRPKVTPPASAAMVDEDSQENHAHLSAHPLFPELGAKQAFNDSTNTTSSHQNVASRPNTSKRLYSDIDVPGMSLHDEELPQEGRGVWQKKQKVVSETVSDEDQAQYEDIFKKLGDCSGEDWDAKDMKAEYGDFVEMMKEYFDPEDSELRQMCDEIDENDKGIESGDSDESDGSDGCDEDGDDSGDEEEEEDEEDEEDQDMAFVMGKR